MTISEAIEAVDGEYSREVYYAREHAEFDAAMRQTVFEEYEQLDRRLPSYVGQIIAATGDVPDGTRLPDYVYIMARMCFRLGMRVQRKLDRPELETTCLWQPGAPQ